MLIWGGTERGGLPTLDPALAARTPHVRVSFVLQRFQITGAAADNVEPEGPASYERMIDYASWETHSSVASEEHGVFGIYFDEGQINDDGYLASALVIYDALVLDACNSFSSFPVSHHADFDPDVAFTTPFEGFDDTTIDSTGFYNFNYAIGVVAEDDRNAVSALHMSGKVNATCTGLSTLPSP